MSLVFQSSAVEQPRLLPQSWETVLRNGFSRSVGLLFCVLATLGWVSLLSWSMADPSPMHATGGPVRNVLGYFGAGFSDLLLQMIGVGAIFALLAPMLWGAELIAARVISRFRLKMMAFPLAILMLAGGLAAVPNPESWPLRNGLGGFLGDAMLIVASGLAGVVVPGYGIALGGLVMFVAGSGLVAYCTGLSQRQIWFGDGDDGRDGCDQAGDAGFDRGGGGAVLVSVGTRVEPSLTRTTEMSGEVGAVESDVTRWGLTLPVEGKRINGRLTPGIVGDGDCEDFSPFQSCEGVAAAPEEAGPGLLRDDGVDDDGLDHAHDHGAADLARRFAPAGAQVRVTDEAGQRGMPGIDRLDMALSGQSNSEVQVVRGAKGWRLPSLQLLHAERSAGPEKIGAEALRDRASQLEDVLRDFGVKGEIKDVRPGPVVTVFELEPQRGTKSARVIGLADDIGRSLGLRAVRIGVVAGRNALGIEVPNEAFEIVGLRQILESPQFRGSEGRLPIALGKSINGEPVVADLARMPHLLVAGTTGSGKSVGINAMILSLLYRFSPEQCRMLLIDPKMLELSVYNDIPHLLAPVVTDPNKAVSALNWIVGEMEERYRRMAKLGVRNIEGFNNRIRSEKARGEPLQRRVLVGYDKETGQASYETEVLDCEELPYIVVVVDEFADLMLVAGKEIEAAVQRLAQMARAAGIHMIMATQRPSVDVVTGTIKSEFSLADRFQSCFQDR